MAVRILRDLRCVASVNGKKGREEEGGQAKVVIAECRV